MVTIAQKPKGSVKIGGERRKNRKGKCEDA